jgi:hypothetical protein
MTHVGAVFLNVVFYFSNPPTYSPPGVRKALGPSLDNASMSVVRCLSILPWFGMFQVIG